MAVIVVTNTHSLDTAPFIPNSPVGPVGPVLPVGPVGPVAHVKPRGPLTLITPLERPLLQFDIYIG